MLLPSVSIEIPGLAIQAAHLPSIQDFVLGDTLCLLEDPICDILGRRATVRHIVLDTKVVVGSARIVACGQEDTAVSLVLADDVGSCRSRENTVSANDKLLDPVGGGNLENLLDSGLRIVPPIAPYNNGGTLGRGGIEDSLDKILGVVLWPSQSINGGWIEINPSVVIQADKITLD